jgi:hypothetical protein
MDQSLVLTLIVIVVPTAAGLGLYTLLRRRGSAAGLAGCAAVGFGVLLSMLITVIFLLASFG